jgi:hypothetical protein
MPPSTPAATPIRHACDQALRPSRLRANAAQATTIAPLRIDPNEPRGEDCLEMISVQPFLRRNGRSSSPLSIA